MAVNTHRICSLYFIGIYAPLRFELFHFEIWPLVLVAAAAEEFALLATWMQGAPTVAPVAKGPESERAPPRAIRVDGPGRFVLILAVLSLPWPGSAARTHGW